MWFTGLAATNTERTARSPVLIIRKWAWMAGSEAIRWCNGWVAKGRKCKAVFSPHK